MIEFIVGILIIVLMFWMVWESTLAISERKERYRAGTHDYYDNPINKKDIKNKKSMMKE